MSNESNALKIITAVGLVLVLYFIYSSIVNTFTLSSQVNTGLIGGLAIGGVFLYVEITKRIPD